MDIQRILHFRMARSDSPVQPEVGRAYKVEQRVTADGVETTWTMQSSNAPAEHYKLSWRDGAAFGMFAPIDSGDWANCEWQPAVAYVLPRVGGASAEYDAQCDYPLPNGAGTGRVYMKGTSRVIEQRDVVLHGMSHRVWVLERKWQTRTSPTARVQTDVSVTSWWSDDLQALVKQDAHVIFAPDAPTHRQEWDVTLELERVG